MPTPIADTLAWIKAIILATPSGHTLKFTNSGQKAVGTIAVDNDTSTITIDVRATGE